MVEPSDPVYRVRRLRHLNLHSLPEEEKEFGGVLWHQMNNLEGLVQDFACALTLFERFYGTMPPSYEFRFPFIAACNGSFTLWNYATALKAVKYCLDSSPSLRARMSVAVVEKTLAAFWDAFPHTKQVRDSIGHESELMKSPKDWKKNATKGFGNMNFLLGNLTGRRYVTTGFDGNLVGYDVTAETLTKLISLTHQVFSAISPGESEIEPPP